MARLPRPGSGMLTISTGGIKVTLTVKGTAARMGSMTRSRMMGMRVQMRTAAPSTAPAPQLPPTRRRASTVTAATVSSLDMAGLQLHQQVEIMQK